MLYVSDFLNTILPATCVGCDGLRVDGPLCPDCDAACPRGLWPLRLDLPAARSVWGFGPYEGPLGAALRRGKYRPDPAAIYEVGARLGLAAAREGLIADRVVAVPQARRAALRRGFAPAEILASAVARRLGAPRVRALRRSAARPPQASVPRGERWRNAAGAFEGTRALRNERILLIDDVLTTGATAQDCARALLDAGARRVEVLAAASPLL